MARKKWTPQEDQTASLASFREKRKWQIALRRYILEKNKCSSYAPFFGLDHDRFRSWIEEQFDEGLSWENFSEAWQLDHLVPMVYFDFANEEDMALCWNFINIRVERTGSENLTGKKIDILAAKAYFARLFERTSYEPARKMFEKLSALEAAQLGTRDRLEQFLLNNKSFLQLAKDFGPYEFDRLNTGASLENIQQEKDFLKKFED